VVGSLPGGISLTHHRPLPDTPPPASSTDQGLFADTASSGGIFNIFRPQAETFGAAETVPHSGAHGPHHHIHGRHRHDSAQNHLPDFGLTGEGPQQSQQAGFWGAPGGYQNYQQEAQPGHRHVRGDNSQVRYDSQPDTGMGSWNRNSSSSDAIAQAAAGAVGHHTYLPRPGSQYYGEHLSAGLGCTSASTNMFFDGLKAAGKVTDADYKRLHQVGNDAAYVNMQHLGVAKPVSGHDLKPGDWAYFKNPGHKHGHSGVVFAGENGELMVANNHGGTTVATPLSAMLRKYGSGSVRGLRADI